MNLSTIVATHKRVLHFASRLTMKDERLSEADILTIQEPNTNSGQSLGLPPAFAKESIADFDFDFLYPICGHCVTL